MSALFAGGWHLIGARDGAGYRILVIGQEQGKSGRLSQGMRTARSSLCLELRRAGYRLNPEKRPEGDELDELLFEGLR